MEIYSKWIFYELLSTIRKSKRKLVIDLFFSKYVPTLTWNVFVYFPTLSISTAHQGIIYKPASTALNPIAIMKAPTAAELAACHGVRNPPTASVTQPHGDSALQVVRTAVFIYKDKDR